MLQLLPLPLLQLFGHLLVLSLMPLFEFVMFEVALLAE
jgi:hypothetical protein